MTNSPISSSTSWHVFFIKFSLPSPTFLSVAHALNLSARFLTVPYGLRQKNYAEQAPSRPPVERTFSSPLPPPLPLKTQSTNDWPRRMAASFPPELISTFRCKIFQVPQWPRSASRGKVELILPRCWTTGGCWVADASSRWKPSRGRPQPLYVAVNYRQSANTLDAIKTPLDYPPPANSYPLGRACLLRSVENFLPLFNFNCHWMNENGTDGVPGCFFCTPASCSILTSILRRLLQACVI